MKILRSEAYNRIVRNRRKPQKTGCSLSMKMFSACSPASFIYYLSPCKIIRLSTKWIRISLTVIIVSVLDLTSKSRAGAFFLHEEWGCVTPETGRTDKGRRTVYFLFIAGMRPFSITKRTQGCPVRWRMKEHSPDIRRLCVVLTFSQIQTASLQAIGTRIIVKTLTSITFHHL